MSKQKSIQKEKRELVEKPTNSKREVYYTPENAFQIIEPYIKDFHSIWDPACGDEMYPTKEYFEKRNHRVICTDVAQDKSFDFFIYKTKKKFDIIVTTPPYSFRKEFLIRVLEFNKPFALLVPVNVLESRTIRESFKANNTSIIFPPKTITFSSPTDSKSVKSLPYSVWVVKGLPNVEKIVYV